MRHRVETFWTAALVLTSAALLAQAPAGTDGKPPEPAATPSPTPTLPPVVSPEVFADRRVTFRLRMPNAQAVVLNGEWSRERPPMAKDANGDWSLTVGPLESDLYGYSFIVDGQSILDPVNGQVKVARSFRTSVVDVTGEKPRADEFADVPHGVLHVHDYVSTSLGRRRGLQVYTPPGYGKDPAQRYPVLYLLHGAGDNEATWISLGRAHWILDKLIAEGKARPMIVVLADGHALWPTPPTPEGRLQNAVAFERDLLEDVVPLVDASYRVVPGARGRALAGVSMGGGHALMFGLRHPDVFAWITAQSASVFDAPTLEARAVTDEEGTNKNVALLWFVVGKTEPLLPGNQGLSSKLTEHGVHHTFKPIDCEHNWRQWRRYLVEVAPLLFADPAPAKK